MNKFFFWFYTIYTQIHILLKIFIAIYPLPVVWYIIEQRSTRASIIWFIISIVCIIVYYVGEFSKRKEEYLNDIHKNIK